MRLTLLLVLLASISGCSVLEFNKLTLKQLNHNLFVCKQQPSTDMCTQMIQDSLHDQAEHPRPQVIKMLLDEIYNGKQADELFLARIPDVASRANFFATNNHYFKHSTMPVKWFAAADYISRRCLFGLGAEGCASGFSFAMVKKFNDDGNNLDQWRKAVGDRIMVTGFSYFKDLFNHNSTLTPMEWDIAQIKREQRNTQPIHEQYLHNQHDFINLTEELTEVDLLDEASRVNYGCRLMKYQPTQGCKP